MAVVDIYTNKDAENGKLAAVAQLTGNKVLTAISTFEIGAGDSVNSIYRIFPDLNPCLIPVDIKVYNDAIGSAGKLDLGLYCGGKGEVVNKNRLCSELAISTAHTGTPANGLAAVDIADLGKQLFELAGHNIANRKDTYDIAFTAKAAPGATGTITVIATFVQG